MNTSCCQESNNKKKLADFNLWSNFYHKKTCIFQGLEDRIIKAFIPSIPVAVKRVISKKEKFPDFIRWSNFYHKKYGCFRD